MEFNYTSENEIINGIRKREPGVFEYLHERCFGPVKVMIKDNRGTDEDVEDIYNEGRLDLMNAVDDPDFKETDKVFKLLITICKNKWLDHHKKMKPDVSIDSLEEEPVGDEFTGDDIDNNVFRNLFWKNFEKLKQDCQKIIKDVLDAIKYAEIAKQMDLKPAYVKKKKHYCYKSLVEFVQQDPDFEEFRKNAEGEDNYYSL